MTTQGEEDRELRIGTPRILRGALFASVALLVAGLCAIGGTAPESFVARYRALRRGEPPGPPEGLRQLLQGVVHAQGHALLVTGLLVLTMVPIGRVAFALVVFARQRDWPFVILTGLVLTLLCVGIFLGRMG
jgi:hypothetical protein